MKAHLRTYWWVWLLIAAAVIAANEVVDRVGFDQSHWPADILLAVVVVAGASAAHYSLLARTLQHMRLVGLAGAVVGALAAAAPVLAGSVNGIWSGRFIIPQEVGNIPSSAYPTAKLAVSAASVSAQFHGKTMAAHDPESAVSTCSMRFRFSGTLSSDGWRVYEDVGKPVISGSGAAGGGMPELSECFQHDPSGDSRVILRVRSAGTKLKAQFGQRVGKRDPEYGSGGLSGYLHH